MVDAVHASRRRCQSRLIADIANHHVKPGGLAVLSLQPCQVAPSAPPGQIVIHDDRVSDLQQATDEVGTDESCTTSYEYSQDSSMGTGSER
jgi:hypothetical protein